MRTSRSTGLVLLSLLITAAPSLAADDLAAELSKLSAKIVHESFQDGNWDLFISAADGSHLVNLTRTKDVDELYPHVSPDGRWVAFSRGPKTKGLKMPPEMVGVEALGWNTCVADARATNRWIALTSDGKSHKEPDWAPPARK